MLSLKKGLIGSVFLVSQSFLEKSIGLISTLILARVLVPEDFGLVAMATIFMGLVGILSNTGGQEYIIRAKSVDDIKLNTNWSINLALKILIAFITLSSAQFVAEYFGDQRVADILYVTSLMTVISGLGSPGNLLLSREQNYRPIVVVNIVAKCIAVTTAITIALVYESFWALVLGQFVSICMRTVGSYIITSYRPSICFTNTREQLNFSSWIMSQAILGYARTQFDSFLIAANFSQSQLGQYNVMKYIAFLPNALILGPATGPLLRQLSAISDTGDHFNKRLNISTTIGLALALYITAVLFLSASSFIELLLGNQWVEYSQLFSMFTYLIPAYLMFHMATRICIVFNKAKVVFFCDAIACTIIFIALVNVGVDSLEVFTAVRVGLENILSFTFLIFAFIKFTSVANTIRMLTLQIPFIVSAVIGCIVGFFFKSESGLLLIDIVITSLIFSIVFILISFLFINMLKGYIQEYKTISDYQVKAYSQAKETLRISS